MKRSVKFYAYFKFYVNFSPSNQNLKWNKKAIVDRYQICVGHNKTSIAIKGEIDKPIYRTALFEQKLGLSQRENTY